MHSRRFPLPGAVDPGGRLGGWTTRGSLEPHHDALPGRVKRLYLPAHSPSAYAERRHR